MNIPVEIHVTVLSFTTTTWPSTAVVLLKIPELSVDSLNESYISRWSLDVLNTMLSLVLPKLRRWHLQCERPNYENGRMVYRDNGQYWLRQC